MIRRGGPFRNLPVAIVALLGLLAASCGTDLSAPRRYVLFGSVSAGADHACAVSLGGQIYCWGAGADGQTGANAGSGVPRAVAAATDFELVRVGGRHSCGLSAAGYAWCWGADERGQLGDGGAATFSASPLPVAGGLRFAALSAGTDHTCGVAEDGEAWCWGANESGQLGDGTTTDRPEPTPGGGGLLFTAIAAGGKHSCALAADGTAWCWGAARLGQLGDLDTVPSSTPVAVSGGRRFASIAAGYSHTCAVESSGGRMYCWGSNGGGELGNSYRTGFDEPGDTKPTGVYGSEAFRQVTAGRSYTCGIGDSGYPYCWGMGRDGQLGTGESTSVSTPRKVAPPEGRPGVHGYLRYTELSAGDNFACGIATGGALYCWGRGDAGQLGVPGAGLSTVPIRVRTP